MTRGKRKSPPASTGVVRIIGGRWRGRKLAVLDSPGLRPSPDRLRETVFNWLAAWLPGARVLDLFAGSGALGLEAASRGAASVVLVEQAPRVAQQLSQNLAQLDAADSVEVVCADWREALRGLDGPFDIVFVDPPFAQQLQVPVLETLRDGFLATEARVHLEYAERDHIDLPASYGVLKDKRFGEVHASLLTLSG